MRDAKEILMDILNCSETEVDMLLESKIEVGETIRRFVPEPDELNIEYIYGNAFEFIATKTFGEHRDIDNMRIYYNGADDTHICLAPGARDYYNSINPNGLSEIENYMNMEFEDQWYWEE